MIRRVSANRATFHSVEFRSGLNVVLADRTEQSSSKDSRNGLGKTTLIEIIHYCLGSSVRKDQALQSSGLKDWAFTVDLDLAGARVAVTRAIEEPKRIVIVGQVPGDEIRPKLDPEGGDQVLTVDQWTRLLGNQCFGLPTSPGVKYSPTFRSLIPHFARFGDAFSSPFEIYPRQKTYQIQTENAFLLGLSWEDARDWQLVRDHDTAVKALRTAQKSGALGGDGKSIGELNALRVRIEGQAARVEESLRSFKVHERYKDIETEANRVTDGIHSLVAANVGDRRLIELYRAALSNERVPDSSEVVRMYEHARVALPDSALRRLEQVQAFHEQVLVNRKAFLGAEIERLTAICSERDEQVAALTTERAAHLEVLRTHGALEEFSRLQAQHTSLTLQVNRIAPQIDLLKRAEEGASAVKIELEQLAKRARADYEERRPILERAISLFNDYSQELYASPGDLIVDIGTNGFTFKVDIPRAGSRGVDQMKIFCYDLALATIWSAQPSSPRLLVHDSTIFADVDERQIAAAIQLAARVSAASGFTYICALNSDKVPRALFDRSFDFDSHVRVRLTDAADSGRLLGIRFERTDVGSGEESAESEET
jgi:uncharacterized protein YydD (DUF2326 family)